jgi:hypothetical protein
VIAFSHQILAPPSEGELFIVPIDLRRVPVVLNPPPPGVPFAVQADAERNFLPQIRDGRLDVIVADDSTVSRSVLTINLRDP